MDMVPQPVTRRNSAATAPILLRNIVRVQFAQVIQIAHIVEHRGAGLLNAGYRAAEGAEVSVPLDYLEAFEVLQQRLKERIRGVDGSITADKIFRFCSKGYRGHGYKVWVVAQNGYFMRCLEHTHGKGPCWPDCFDAGNSGTGNGLLLTSIQAL